MNPNQPQFETYWRKRISEETKINNREIDFYGWLDFGKEMKWCSDVVCETHDLVPITEKEERMWEKGEDPCCTIVRIW